MPEYDVARAKRYNRWRLAAFAAATCWRVVWLLWFARDRRAATLRRNIGRSFIGKRAAGPAFLTAAGVLSWLLELPVSYLGGHLLERRFGLTRQTGRAWLGERVKALLVGSLLQTPLLTAGFLLIRRRPRDWWLIASAISAPLAAALSYLTPVLLMPRFNRFELLDDPVLVARIRALADRSGVRISDVYQMDMSRQTEKPNAFFTGTGSTKRIVLSDTLLQRFPEEEIACVVAHELGHQAHGDIWRLIGFASGAGFGGAWLLSRMAPRVIRASARTTGVSELGDEASWPVLALLLTALGGVLMPVQAAFSRSLERRADRFAVELTSDGETYAKALRRLAGGSLADPDPPSIVVWLLYSHPPIGERIQSATSSRGGSASVLGAGT